MWPVFVGILMVSASFRVASCELETNHNTDAGETRRQEDRRGILAVKSGPPTRVGGGVAEEVRPLQEDACSSPLSGPRAYYGPDPPRVPRHSAILKWGRAARKRSNSAMSLSRSRLSTNAQPTSNPPFPRSGPGSRSSYGLSITLRRFLCPGVCRTI